MDVITIFAGDNEVVNFTIRHDGTLLDLTNITLTFIAARSSQDVPLITKTTGSGIVHTNPTGGVCEVTFYPSDTAGLAQNGMEVLVWELRAQQSVNVYTIATGYLTVLPVI